ncbi:MAG: hypothetical protein PHQ35_05750 [Phycisphaerae bacterium]|nr:hypothetical protein [Phycisphaerae bacterium]MDD5381316.1 hypothetical protein [Phycisphaerae bacterium]
MNNGDNLLISNLAVLILKGSKMKNVNLILLIVIGGTVIFGAMGCSTEYHAGEVKKGLQESDMTLGKVQREVKVGMSSSEVVEAIGSPNIVTKDSNGNETWVYDKVATDVAVSKGYWTLLLIGQEAGAASSSQRTLTIIIKFDEKSLVKTLSYHASKF